MGGPSTQTSSTSIARKRLCLTMESTASSRFKRERTQAWFRSRVTLAKIINELWTSTAWITTRTRERATLPKAVWPWTTPCCRTIPCKARWGPMRTEDNNTTMTSSFQKFKARASSTVTMKRIQLADLTPTSRLLTSKTAPWLPN